MSRVGNAHRAVGARRGCAISSNASPMETDGRTLSLVLDLASLKNGRWGDTGETEEIYEDLDLLESVANNIANVDTMTWNTILRFWHRRFVACCQLSTEIPSGV